MENKRMNENILYKEDIIRIILIIFVALVAIVGTWIMVNNKHKGDHKQDKVEYLKIDNNDVYTYEKKDKIINFYDKNNELISSYTCTFSCNLASSTKNDFSINDSSNVAINDKDKYIIFDIDNGIIKDSFDTQPYKLTNSEYAIALKNGKYGLIDAKLEIIIGFNFDLIEETDGFLITVNDKLLNVLNSSFNRVNSDPIEIDEYSLIQSSLDEKMMTIKVTSVDGKKTSFKLRVS